MRNQSEYAVLRFVNQGSGYHMIHDYIKGSTVIQFAKKGNKVQKETVFLWLEQLAVQLEHCMLCEEQEIYGEVNPYAVIVTEDNKVLLLDLDAESNLELMKKMRKKKIRSLFVSRGRVLSRSIQIEDDFYGFSQVLKFMVDCCCVNERYTRTEEKGLIRIMNLCLKPCEYKNDLWKEIRGELRRLRSRVVHCDSSKRRQRRKNKFRKYILIILLAVLGIWMNKSIVSAWFANTFQEEIQITDPVVNKAYREAGLVYFSEFSDVENAEYYLDRAAEEDRLSRIYIQILKALKYGVQSEKERLELKNTVEEGRKILKEYDRKNHKYDQYLYEFPFVKIYWDLNSDETNRQVIELCEGILENLSYDGEKQRVGNEIKVREILGSAYEREGKNKKAVFNYKKLKDLEKNPEKLAEVYSSISRIYVQEKDKERNLEILQEATLKVPNSEKLWLNYIESGYADENLSRDVCQEIVKKAVKEIPDLEENVQFDELRSRFGIEVSK